MSLNFSSGVQRFQTLVFGKKVQSQETSDSKINHYRFDQDGEQSRIHLRLDEDGSGTLIVNANRIMHLNPTAALMAKLVLDGKSDEQVVRVVTKTWNVKRATAEADLATFNLQLSNLVRPDGACPVHELELDMLMPFSARPSAPYRLDLALTYRCNNDCHHCYNLEHPKPGQPLEDHFVPLDAQRADGAAMPQPEVEPLSAADDRHVRGHPFAR